MDVSKNKLNFEKGGGLIPTVVVDRASGKILMLAFSSPESLELTFRTGFAHFFSRERGKIWKKGEESGNTMKVFRVLSDCDLDSLIFVVEPSGPACHTGEPSCFFHEVKSFEVGVESEAELSRSEFQGGILYEIEKVLFERKKEMEGGKTAEGSSYTFQLFSGGVPKIISKIMEEAGELCESALKFKKSGSEERGEAKTPGGVGEKDSLVWESADLLFHIIMLLVYLGIPLDRLIEELKRRREIKKGRK